MPPEHTSRGFRSRRRPLELLHAPTSSCTAQSRARGSELQLNPKSWARAVPVSHLRLASTEVCRERPPGLQSPCSCPSTPSPRLIRSKVSTMDFRRAHAGCSIRPLHRSKMEVAACSRGDASHGLFMTSRPGTCRPSTRQTRGFRSRSRPLELPHAPDPSCTAQPREHGSKSELNLSSWARAVPISRLSMNRVQVP